MPWRDHCIQGNIRPRFILALVASGQIPMTQNYLYLTQLCFGEFNLGQDKTVCKCRWAKITRGENNLVYSINQIKSNNLDFILKKYNIAVSFENYIKSSRTWTYAFVLLQL